MNIFKMKESKLRKYIQKIKDINVLVQLAQIDESPIKYCHDAIVQRINAIGPETLGKLTLNPFPSSIRAEAVKLIKDFDIRLNVLLNDSTISAQCAALRGSQKELADMVIMMAEYENNHRWQKSMAHFEGIVGEDAQPIINDKNEITRILCAPYCIAWDEYSSYSGRDNREGWFVKISDEASLSYVAENAVIKEIRIEAFNRLESLAKTFALKEETKEIMQKGFVYLCKKEDIKNISDQETLSDIAKNSGNDDVRLEAVAYLTDNATLYDIYKVKPNGSTQEQIHYRALWRITSPDILREILSGKIYDNERMIAAANLQDQDILENMVQPESIEEILRGKGSSERNVVSILLPALKNEELKQKLAIQFAENTVDCVVLDDALKLINDSTAKERLSNRETVIRDHHAEAERLRQAIGD